MKCPRCHFISFDNLARCKKCGALFKDETECIDRSTHLNRQDQRNMRIGRPATVTKTLESIRQDLEDLDMLQQRSLPASGLMQAGPEKMAALRTVYDGKQAGPLQYAGFSIRLLAYSIDIMLIVVITLLLAIGALWLIKIQSVVGADLISMISFIYMPYMVTEMLIEGFYFTYFHAVTGQTVGKRICGIRVLRVNGEALGFKKACARFCGYLLCRILLYVGFMWIAVDRRKQGWHDKIAGSCVIRE